MTPLITVLLTTATALVGLAIAVAKGDLYRSAPPWLVPGTFTLAGILYGSAAILAIFHLRRERKKDAAVSSPLAKETRTTVSQNFNPQFNPQQNFYIGSGGLGTVTSETDENQLAVLNLMRRVRPEGFHALDEIAAALHFTNRRTLDALEKLERDKRVYQTPIDQAVGGMLWRLEELERLPAETAQVLPQVRPIIVPTRYGKIESGPEAGHTGIAVRNDGEPAYTVTAPERVEILHVGSLILWGTPRNLRRGEPDLSVPVSKEDANGSSTGARLYDFMVKHGLDTITIPFTYRDANEVSYQTDVIVMKDQMARSIDASESGLRLDWKQKRLSNS